MTIPAVVTRDEDKAYYVIGQYLPVKAPHVPQDGQTHYGLVDATSEGFTQPTGVQDATGQGRTPENRVVGDI